VGGATSPGENAANAECGHPRPHRARFKLNALELFKMNCSRWFTLVIARCAKRAVAIQLDCFVAALLAMTGVGYSII
jgi:hypothetical protein